jgi:8-oxo-dGTP diphosphatase
MRLFLPVVLALIQDKNKFLLTLRSGEAKDARFAGHWQIPGGELKFDEDVEAAAIREVKEETGLTVEIVHLVPKFYHRVSGTVHLLFIVYLCKPQGSIDSIRLNHEATEYGWFTAEEIMKLPKTLPNVREVVKSI